MSMTGKLRLHKVRPARYIQFVTTCDITNLHLLGPDLQKILRQTYDSAALTPDLRRACELRAIN